MRLENQVAVITGGASGISRVVAVAMAREGAKVVIADINPEKAKSALQEVEAAGSSGLVLEVDVAEKNQVDRMIAEVMEAYGRIDILVCGAAVKKAEPLLELTVESWDRTMAVNVRGVMLCVQGISKIMAEQKYGRIVLMNSLAAFRGRRHQQAYCSSKAALLAFAKNAALQLARYGITVNGVAPGIIDTEEPEPLFNREERIAHIPARRMGTLEDVAGPVLFLVTDESLYVNGETLLVDGAFSVRLTGCDI